MIIFAQRDLSPCGKLLLVQIHDLVIPGTQTYLLGMLYGVNAMLLVYTVQQVGRVVRGGDLLRARRPGPVAL